MITNVPPPYGKAEMHIDEDDYCTEETAMKTTPIKKIMVIAGAVIGVALLIVGIIIKKKVAA